jgi:hypothetical protein
MRKELREDSAAGVHPPLFRSGDSPSFDRKGPSEFQIVPALGDRTSLVQKGLFRSSEK